MRNFKIYKSKENSLMKSNIPINQLKQSSTHGQSYFINTPTRSFHSWIMSYSLVNISP